MVESVARTASQIDLILVIDEDDPERKGYEALAQRHPFVQVELNRLRVPFMLHYNLVFQRHPNYEYYSATNDDFVYHTERWDELLMGEIERKFSGWGWAFGNDLHRGEKLPTTSVVSGNICRVLGWLQMPWLRRNFGDDAVLVMGQALNRISYVPDVVIEHRHPSIGKNVQDKIYKKGRTAFNHHRDKMVFRFWRYLLLPRQKRLLEQHLP